MDYLYTEDKVKEILSEKFKHIPEDVRNAWIKERIDNIIIDGTNFNVGKWNKVFAGSDIDGFFNIYYYVV